MRPAPRALRLAAAALALAAAAACSDDPDPFKPASFVDKLRILGVRSTPPELYPGEAGLVESLVVDPLSGARPLSFLWLLCDPDPSGSAASACARQDTSRGLGALVGPDGQLPEGVRVVPLGDSAYYRAPLGAFDQIPPDAPERAGVLANVLLVAYAGLNPQDLQDDAVAREIALKRVRIVPKGTKRNRNPKLAEVRLAGASFTEAEPPLLAPGDVVRLSAAAAAGSAEPYVRTLPDGTQLDATESIAFSWFANAGAFDELQQQAARTRDGEEIAFTVPPFDQTSGGAIDVWVVLRDDRGGLDWTHRRLRVAP